jgi:hypothetical protein
MKKEHVCSENEVCGGEGGGVIFIKSDDPNLEIA